MRPFKDGAIIIVGDLFPTSNNIHYFCKGDIDSLFGERIEQLFAGSDLRICNLEGSLSDQADRCVKTGPIKVATSKAVSAYKALGFDYCMLANNHITDGGHQGVLDSMKVLNDAGISYIGAGKNQDDIAHFFTRDVGGMKIGIYNVSETMYNIPTPEKAGVWLYDEYVVCKELQEVKAQCDYLIVIYHGGIEKFRYPSPETRKRFHRMADNGADMVLSQHTHCVGCEEDYNGSYLLYGQGDFLLKNFAPGLTDSGLLLELVIRDRHVQINKHFVCSENNLFVRYSDRQDFSSFDKRSKEALDERFVVNEFSRFCLSELKLYLNAFKSPSMIMRGFGRLFPGLYEKWLYSYATKDLLFVLHTLRSEQNRETVIEGLESYVYQFLESNKSIRQNEI